jgi:hypothetical protein
VAGVSADTFAWDLDCDERNKKAKTKAFVISIKILGFKNKLAASRIWKHYLNNIIFIKILC